MSNQEVIEDFLVDCRTQGMQESTIDIYRLKMTIIDRFYDKNLKELDNGDLKELLNYLQDERGIGNTTIAHYFKILSSFFNYLEYKELVDRNILPNFRRRYLKQRMKNQNTNVDSKRQIISVEQMRNLVNSIIDPRDRAIMVLLAKTGVRVSELGRIEMGDIDFHKRTITLKKNGKRSNLKVLFDVETENVLRRWINARNTMNYDGNALFISYDMGERKPLSICGIRDAVTKYARRLGIHKDRGRLEERFTPHCARHWFTTFLRKSGMPREYIKYLRGDSLNETMDIYNHIDFEELKESYDRCIPKLLV
jgi:integrase/recombinase XerD